MAARHLNQATHEGCHTSHPRRSVIPDGPTIRRRLSQVAGAVRAPPMRPRAAGLSRTQLQISPPCPILTSRPACPDTKPRHRAGLFARHRPVTGPTQTPAARDHGAMRTHTAIPLLAAAGILTLTGCSSDPKPVPAPAPAVTQSPNPDAARSAAGLPPEPKGAQRAAFLAGLNAIDKDIVHGKDDKAISRGIDTCATIKSFPGDQAKQADQVNKRWTSPTHPDGHGLTTAAQILTVAHATICPTY
jgi:hypothetical protein